MLAPRGGFGALVASGSLKRLALLVSIWIAQTLGFYGFNSWVPTLLTEHGFSIVRSLEQASVMQIGAVPGAWIAASISDRWERKSLIAIVALAVGTCGMIYGLSFRTSTIVIFGFLVAMGQQVFAPLLYAYTPECFPTEARNTGTGASYGIGRLGNALGPLIVALSVRHVWIYQRVRVHRRLLGNGRDSRDGVRTAHQGPHAGVESPHRLPASRCGADAISD